MNVVRLPPCRGGRGERSSKQCEIHRPICTMFKEARVRREIVLVTMFKHKHTIFSKNTAFKHHVRNLRQLFQGVRRVGEDEIKLLTAALYKLEHITTDEHIGVVAQLLKTLTNETCMVAVGLYTHYFLATTTDKLKRDTACA